ncbi:hypothetical protein PAECIP111802_05106 [Paenibacillus allorhizosphaerae]|uniref:Uncharacterized protein n=1 Tax=Paenibacillus allorhizosphaerae TaxID=2849866 RepID=A0ABM8VNV9_9BACL|nr:hypothetical protein PAECIP111802_05106 [Paenibacillus allorhizosphaerae]
MVRMAGNDPYSNAVAFAKYKDPATDFGWGITTPGHNFSFINKNSTARSYRHLEGFMAVMAPVIRSRERRQSE